MANDLANVTIKDEWTSQRGSGHKELHQLPKTNFLGLAHDSLTHAWYENVNHVMSLPRCLHRTPYGGTRGTGNSGLPSNSIHKTHMQP